MSEMADESVNNGTQESQDKLSAKAESYVQKVVKEKHALDKETYPIAHRLLDEEIKKTKETKKAPNEERYLDLYNEKPIDVTCRVQFPTKDCPSFNFVGKLLGPKGHTLQQLQEMSRCRMFIFGKGSMRDKAKEDQLRASGDPKYAHLSDELHVLVSCTAPPTEAHHRMAYALQQLKEVMVPDPPLDDEYPPLMPFRDGAPYASHAKAMSFLEKAHHAMEFEPPMPPRRFPPARGGFGAPRGGPIPDRGGRGGFGRGRGGGAGFYPPRKTPYGRP